MFDKTQLLTSSLHRKVSTLSKLFMKLANSASDAHDDTIMLGRYLISR